MHILTVLDHPSPQSFSAAAAARFMSGCEAAGHTVELADLHAEGFDPRWSMADITREGAAAAGTDIAAEQARIMRAEAICLVFPLFWWGMPAMMKGWLDRVWSYGWAYDDLDDREKSLLPARPGLLLVPAGARSDQIEDAGYLQAMQTAWEQGTFGYFGLRPYQLELLCGSTGSDARRADLLARCYDLGLNIGST